MRRTTCSKRSVGTLVTAILLMWKSRSHLEVIQERDGRKRMKLREKVHSGAWVKRFSTVSLRRGAEAGREGRGASEGPPSSPPLSPDSIYSSFSFSRPGLLSFTSKSSDLNLHNRSLTPISNVPGPRWWPAELKQKPIFKLSMHLKDNGLYVTE